MFGKLRRRAPAPSTTAHPIAPATGALASLVGLVGQQRSLSMHLDKKALLLASLRARPLGWTNSLPVVLRPDADTSQDHASQRAQSLRTANVPPAQVPGTPLWHRQPE